MMILMNYFVLFIYLSEVVHFLVELATISGYYRVKVYHCGSWQDSGSPRQDIFPEAEPRKIGQVKGNQNLANFRNGILNCFIIPKHTLNF